MPIEIIDLLEAIEIDEQHRHIRRGMGLQHGLEMSQELAAIGEAGEVIQGGFPDRLLLGQLLRLQGLLLRLHGGQLLEAQHHAAAHPPQQGTLLQLEGLAGAPHHQQPLGPEGHPEQVIAPLRQLQPRGLAGRCLQQEGCSGGVRPEQLCREPSRTIAMISASTDSPTR